MKGIVFNLLEGVAAAANIGDSIAEVFGFALAQICQFKNWAVGHACIVARSGEKERLASTPIWHVHRGARVEEVRRATEAAQGYFFSRPVDASSAMARLAAPLFAIPDGVRG